MSIKAMTLLVGIACMIVPAIGAYLQTGDVDDEDEAEQALMNWMTSRNLAQMDMSDTTIRFGLLLIAVAVVMP